MANDKEKFKTELKRRVYQLALDLMKFIDGLPKEQSVKIISNQLMRCGTSIGANYIEAQAASSKKDFINFIHHALKSANESKFWLGLLRDSGKADRSKADALLKEVVEIANILAKSLMTLKGKN